jgi:hypothetical protein
MGSNENRNESEKDDEAIELNYRIDDNPPWYLSLLLGFQVKIRYLNIQSFRLI